MRLLLNERQSVYRGATRYASKPHWRHQSGSKQARFWVIWVTHAQGILPRKWAKVDDLKISSEEAAFGFSAKPSGSLEPGKAQQFQLSGLAKFDDVVKKMRRDAKAGARLSRFLENPLGLCGVRGN